MSGELYSFDDQLKRLKEAAKVATDSALMSFLSVKPSGVYNARRRGAIPHKWFVSISTSCGVNLEWLLTGEGEMRAGATTPNGLKPETLEAPTHQVVMVPMVEARLSAGHGSFETDGTSERKYSFRSDFLRRKGKINSMVMMRVAGDSMSPAIEDGDVVLIDQSQTAPRAGDIYAVGVEDVVYLKRLNAEPGKIILSSFNPAYAPFEIDTRGDLENSVRIIGRVIWSCREW